ncbi:MAG: L-threonylcarbamoyladenylate synthase [Bacteroidota bacterium]|jgi:L-threonylcarbamoyladenylate synthase
MAKLVHIFEAVNIIREGGVVAVPTETVYGLAADATNAEAIARIYKAKNRPADNPLICHFHSIEHILEWGITPNDTALKLLQSFTPGPISMLLNLPSDSSLKNATCQREQIIVRIPSNNIFAALILGSEKPLAAPSANTSGRFSGTNAMMVQEDLGELIDAIIDGGSSEHGLESTIVDCTEEGTVKILRPGPIGSDQIREVIGPDIKVTKVKSGNIIPGSKYRHYAPTTPLFWFNADIPFDKSRNPVLILTMQDEKRWKGAKHYDDQVPVVMMGDENQPEAISHNLYQCLYHADSYQRPLAYISHYHASHNTGIGIALEERLTKAVEGKSN